MKIVYFRYEWREHSFFRLRYSYPTGLVLIFFALIIAHFHLTHYMLDDLGYIEKESDLDHALYGISLSIGYIIYGLIWYRANLIFLTWKQYQSKLNRKDYILKRMGKI